MVLDDLISRLSAIYNQCGGQDPKEPQQEVVVESEFAVQRKKAHHMVTELRSSLRVLDEKMSNGVSTPDVVSMTLRVRGEINALQQQLQVLMDMCGYDPKSKTAKKKQPTEEQKQVIELVRSHYEELSNKFNTMYAVRSGQSSIDQGPITQAETMAYKEAVSRGFKSDLPEIDTDIDTALELARHQDAIIDQKLEIVDQGVTELQQKVRQIDQRVQVQVEMIDNLNKQMDEVQEQLNTENQRIKEVLKKVRPGEKVCVDLIMVALIAGLVVLFFV